MEAARELSVTRPAVSKQIRLLETSLGCRLLDRSVHGCALTPAGQELFKGLNQAFDLIAMTTERVAESIKHDRKIKVLVERDFASSWLAQRIGDFLIGNPGISVEVVAERNGRLSMGENYSFRIFYGRAGCFQTLDLVSETLCHWIDLPVCTPAYAASYLRDGSSLDMAHFLLDGNYNPWKRWFAAAEISDPGARATYTTFNETTLCLSTAIAGGGITIGDSFLCMAAIESGALTVPFKVGLRSEEVYSLYYPKDGLTLSDQKFRDWLTNQIRGYNSQISSKLESRGIAVLDL
jgi:DNA-binding transcriptional LysR family regulator